MTIINYCIIIILLLIVIYYWYFDSRNVDKYIVNYTTYNYIYKKNPINEYDVLKQKIHYDDSNLTTPNYLFQTYYDKTKIPEYIFEGINKYASNYKYLLLDDMDALNFLNIYFTKSVIDRFNELSYGAHKADLLRYCLLYIFGGVYLDIKTILIKPLDEILVNKNYFYTCLSKFKHKDTFESYIYQGIIASPPNNPLFLRLISFIVNAPIYYLNYPIRIYYLMVIKHLYSEILKDIKYIDPTKTNLELGINQGKTNTYYFFEESCDKSISETCTTLDRYGLCCSIYDFDNVIFIGRDPSFPW